VPHPDNAPPNLLIELEVRRLAMEVTYQAWIGHYYIGKGEPIPEDPKPFADARRIVSADDEELIADEVSPGETYEAAFTFLYAFDKYRDIVETLAAELAYSHPEHLEELNHRLKKIRGEGEEDSPDPS